LSFSLPTTPQLQSSTTIIKRLDGERRIGESMGRISKRRTGRRRWGSMGLKRRRVSKGEQDMEAEAHGGVKRRRRGEIRTRGMKGSKL